MSDRLLGRTVPDATKCGVAGGVLLAAIYVVGYVFLYELVTVTAGSTWGIGEFGLSTSLLPGTIHVGFLLIPGFVVSTVVVGIHRWRSAERDRRTDVRLLYGLVLTPILVGAVLGIGFAVAVFGRLLLSGDGGEILSFVLVLGIALFVAVVNGTLMLAVLTLSTLAGYVVVETTVVLASIATDVR